MAVSLSRFLEQLTECGLVPADQLSALQAAHPSVDAEQFAKLLVKQKLLTPYQVQAISTGRGKSLVLGNYLILDKLGQGGMGMVLKAQHRRMKRIVALKVLSPTVAKSPELIARFHREVEAAAKLTHPNIVAAFDADEHAGTSFLVMEYVEGRDLASLVKSQGPLSIGQASKCIIQAAKGLEYAHSQRIVHRDIKPANLLIDRQGTVKILDMGLARIDNEAGRPELTSTGAVMGTVDYMAPEQALSTKHADARSDIYSLGITLWYLLVGKAAYDGDSMMARLLAHRDSEIPSLIAMLQARPSGHPSNPQKSEAIDRVFRRMVAKKPEDRFQTMTEVIAALESLGSSESVLADGSAGGSLFGNPSASSPTLDRGGQPQTRPLASAATAAVEDDVLVPGSPFAATMSGSRSDVATDPNPTRNSPRAPALPPRKSRGQKSPPPADGNRRKLLLGGGAFGLLVLLGIIVITIRNRDGSVTKLEVPDTSKVEISTQPDVAATGKGDAPAAVESPGDVFDLLATEVLESVLQREPKRARRDSEGLVLDDSLGQVAEPLYTTSLKWNSQATRLLASFRERTAPLQSDSGMWVGFGGNYGLLQVGLVGHPGKRRWRIQTTPDFRKGGYRTLAEAPAAGVTEGLQNMEVQFLANHLDVLSDGKVVLSLDDVDFRPTAVLAGVYRQGVVFEKLEARTPWAAVRKVGDPAPLVTNLLSDEQIERMLKIDPRRASRQTDGLLLDDMATSNPAKLFLDSGSAWSPAETSLTATVCEQGALNEKMTDFWMGFTSESQMMQLILRGPPGSREWMLQGAGDLRDGNSFRPILRIPATEYPDGRRQLRLDLDGKQLVARENGKVLFAVQNLEFRPTRAMIGNHHSRWLIESFTSRPPDPKAPKSPMAWRLLSSPFVDLGREYQTLGPFRAVNGELHADKSGLAAVNGIYGDFELEFDWKTVQGGNSGVYYRVDAQAAGQNAGFPALELQLIDNQNQAKPLAPAATCGALWGLVPPTTDASRPAGEWNAVRIVAQGKHVEHWLNGQKVVEYDIGSPAWQSALEKASESLRAQADRSSGSILLQGHNGLTSFRNIRIRGQVVENPPPKVLAEKSSPQPDWIPLISATGNFQTHWKSLGPFKDVTGELQASSSGLASTREQFDNFDLEFEWKIAPGGNSGLYYRTDASKTGTAGSYPGTEFQLLDNGSHPDGKNAKTSTGSLYGVIAASRDASKPPGEWNSSRVLADGNHVQHWVNGSLVVDYEIDSSAWKAALAQSKNDQIRSNSGKSTGNILLQGHTGLVQFRNMRIRRLPSAPVQTGSGVLSFDGVDDLVAVPTLRCDGTHPLTLEFWVRAGAQPEPAKGQQPQVIGWDGAFQVTRNVAENGQFAVWGRAESALKTAYASSRCDGSLFHHVACQWTGKSLQVALDGKLGDPYPLPVLTNTVAQAGLRSDHFVIGGGIPIGKRAAAAVTNFFRGELREIRLSRVVRYPADFAPSQRFSPDADTIALWHCDEGSGETLRDASGNGHDGRISGATWR